MGQSQPLEEAFEEIDAVLGDFECDITASEFHGLTSGLIAGGLQPSPQQWLETLGLHLNFQRDPSPADQELLFELFNQTFSQLTDNDLNFEFRPLLPDDDFPLVDRLESLGQWCRGLLEGIALSGLGEKLQEAGDTRELIQDLSSISQIDSNCEEDDEAENSYMELVEYVRIGCMNLYSNLVSEKVASEKNKSEEGTQVEGASTSQSDSKKLH